jgi:hypothetical protein
MRALSSERQASRHRPRERSERARHCEQSADGDAHRRGELEILIRAAAFAAHKHG